MDDPTDRAASEYRYDAFISYRHVEPDRAWAKWLHRALETWRTPKPLVAKGTRARLAPVFRDEDELPASADLSREIDAALEQSRFLIVICSPRTPESKWVNQEIVRFREMGRGDRILALLVEGEPSESFPPALRTIRRQVTESATTAESLEEVEPLAADVRASRDEKPAFLKRMARLRLLACVLGCRFDDLRQRESERQRRRLRLVAGGLVGLVLLLSGLATLAVLARAEAERERDAKALALEEVLRLADGKRARDLIAAADSLWPRFDGFQPVGLAPEQNAMLDWERVARDLVERRPEHELALEIVSQELTAAAANTERELSRQVRSLPEQSYRFTPDAALADARERESTLRWRKEALEDLLRNLKLISSPAEDRDLLRIVEGRRKLADEMWQTSRSAEWQESIEEIAVSPRYGGLRVAPQVGLVPLGPDPDSGLFEFLHLGSGSTVTRDETSRRLVYLDDAAIVLVLIPEGTFKMGAQREDPSKANYDPDATAYESPVHEVSLRPYFISKCEMTVAQWTAAGLPRVWDRATGLGPDADFVPRQPAMLMSWEEASAWLPRHGLTLPTEAQWERAARAGSDSPWSFGSRISDLAKFAASNDIAGRHRPNGFGLFDVHGNVEEWCSDGAEAYGQTPSEYAGWRRAARGGWQMRSAQRSSAPPKRRDSALGVRPARPLLP